MALDRAHKTTEFTFCFTPELARRASEVFFSEATSTSQKLTQVGVDLHGLPPPCRIHAERGQDVAEGTSTAV